MWDFFVEQGRTRLFGEAYLLYAAAGNPRRTQISGKMDIYGWTRTNSISVTSGGDKKRMGGPQVPEPLLT